MPVTCKFLHSFRDCSVLIDRVRVVGVVNATFDSVAGTVTVEMVLEAGLRLAGRLDRERIAGGHMLHATWNDPSEKGEVSEPPLRFAVTKAEFAGYVVECNPEPKAHDYERAVKRALEERKPFRAPLAATTVKIQFNGEIHAPIVDTRPTKVEPA